MYSIVLLVFVGLVLFVFALSLKIESDGILYRAGSFISSSLLASSDFLILKFLQSNCSSTSISLEALFFLTDVIFMNFFLRIYGESAHLYCFIAPICMFSLFYLKLPLLFKSTNFEP